MMRKDEIGLPWNELIDRLYHRQDPEVILDDFTKRGIVNEESRGSTLELLNRLKGTVESFRLNSQGPPKK
jgi:hypothetical protein